MHDVGMSYTTSPYLQRHWREEFLIRGFRKSLRYRATNRICRWYRLTVTPGPSTLRLSEAEFWEGGTIRHCQELEVRMGSLKRSIVDGFEKACQLVRYEGPRSTRRLENNKREVRRLFVRRQVGRKARKTDSPTEYPSERTG